MTMTQDQVLKLLKLLDSGGARGMAEAIRRSSRTAMNSTTLTANERAFLDSVNRVGSRPQPALQYRHPAQVAGVAPRSQIAHNPRTSEPLTAAQVAWLSRLPTEPAKISHEDAVEVFRLAALNTSKSDRPLIRSIAQPLAAYHDRRQAEANLAHANLEPAAVPPTAVGALADVIGRDNDQLRPDEALQRASEVITKFKLDRSNDRGRAKANAQAQIDRLDEDARRHARGEVVANPYPFAFEDLAGADERANAYAAYRADHGDQQTGGAIAQVAEAYSSLSSS